MEKCQLFKLLTEVHFSEDVSKESFETLVSVFELIKKQDEMIKKLEKDLMISEKGKEIVMKSFAGVLAKNE